MTAKKTQSGLLKAASTLQPGDRSVEIYNDWAGSYDRDLTDEWGYIAPRIAAEALMAICPDPGTRIIDLGCGTGLVGLELSNRGYSLVDGLDVSTGMLAEARAKNVYRSLFEGDLTKRTPLADCAYDAVLCVGSMGAGHVDASHLPEMLRVAVEGGPLVIYMNDVFYQAENFEAAFRSFETKGLWTIDRIETSNYMSRLDRPGKLIVAHRSAPD